MPNTDSADPVEKEQRIIGYLSGPVDAVEVYDRWRANGSPDYLGTSYLTHFFRVVKALNARGVVVTSLPGEVSKVIRGRFTMINIPKPGQLSGWRYHWRNAAWLRGAMRRLVEEKCREIVLTDAQDYWFQLIIERVRGIRFINALHACLWAELTPPRTSRKILSLLNGWMHYRFCDPTIAASDRILDQVRRSSCREDRFSRVFLPTYSRTDFETFIPPDHPGVKGEFRVLYAGRVVRNKGVFDLVEAAVLLRRSRHNFRFIICGDGPDLPDLIHAARKSKVDSYFSFEGFCARQRLLALLSEAHSVVVPSRRELEEGFAMIACEGVIALRPVITSAVCPALDHIRGSSIEATPDDPTDYARCIEALLESRSLFEELGRNTKREREQFFDRENSYESVLLEALNQRYRG